MQVLHRIVQGPRHVLTQVQLLQEQPQVVKDIVSPYVATGAWFAHPEAVLLSLVCSSDREGGELGARKILERRGEEQYGDTRVRSRRTPDINFSASSISDLISWDRDIHEPSFTCSLTKEQIKELEDTPFPAPDFPLHSQSCERAVKQVS